MTPIGTVTSLARYPVKSMRGERLASADMTAQGIYGDRTYAILDIKSGKIATAKRPKEWAKLLEFRASFLDAPRIGKPLPPLVLIFPDGTRMRSDAALCDDALSKILARCVALLPLTECPTRETLANFSVPEGMLFDSAPLHLISTATLAELHKYYPKGNFDAERFRPNIVIATCPETQGFPENDWVGRTIVAGTAVLYATKTTKRCVMTTLAQNNLPKDAGILRAIGTHNNVRAGIYACLMEEGVICLGDTAYA